MEKRSISRGEAIELIERQESHFWDQKSMRSRGSVIQKVSAALANADGGEFIVGIEDRSKGSGLDRWQGFSTIEDANFVLEALARDVKPPVPYTLEYLTVQDRDAAGIACLIHVRKSESVHYTADEKVPIRRGASTVMLTGRTITDLSLAKGTRSYEDQLLEDYLIEDLIEEDELAYFLRSYSPSTDPTSFARKQRLVERNTGKARITAAILYAASPSAVVPKRCAVKVARYNTKEEIPRREHLAGVPKTIEGPARVVIEETLKEVASLIEAVSMLTPEGKLKPLRYPPEALKEIIVNAVIHRDYNVSDDIRVYVFDNRVEVQSPGALPGHMTLSNLLTERFSRNPTIVRLLNKYPDPPNKDIGEGLRTVLNKMAEAKLQAPKFHIVDNHFVVKLGHAPLARPHEIVMDYLKNHDEITNATGRGLTGITSENSMKDVFYSLRDRGIIEMVPGKRGNRSAWRKKVSEAAESGDPEKIISPESASSQKTTSGKHEHQPEKGEGDTGSPDVRSFIRRPGKKFRYRKGRTVARNDPCPCGGGVKYKRCCGRPGGSEGPSI